MVEDRDNVDLSNDAWLLEITHKFGTNRYLFSKLELCDAQLGQYVKEYWSDRFPDKDMPTNLDAAIDDYFYMNEEEDFSITLQEVYDSILVEDQNGQSDENANRTRSL